MTTDDETQETPDPKELARRLMIAAAQFAAASMEAYNAAHPEQAALLAGIGGSFGVRVSDILSPNPRVGLVSALPGGEEVEVAHVVLSAPGAHDLRRAH
jgi:hypothetical protein